MLLISLFSGMVTLPANVISHFPAVNAETTVDRFFEDCVFDTVEISISVLPVIRVSGHANALIRLNSTNLPLADLGPVVSSVVPLLASEANCSVGLSLEPRGRKSAVHSGL